MNQGYAAFHDFEKVPAKALESDRLIVFLGRLEQRKGIDLVLEAANRLLAGKSDAHLVVAGRDVEGWVARSASLLKPSARKRTFFLGEISDSTREKLLARASVLLFPSRYESFGLVPLEAFVHGVPVVAADAGAVPEVVINDRCGLLFPAENAKAMADRVEQILMDPTLRRRLSDGARQRIRTLSSRKMALESVELYRQLL